MLKQTGGTKARNGYYLNLASWELIPAKTDQILPGAGDQKYLRVPALALFVLAPFLGALFVVFLPFIGFALVLGYVGQRIGEAVGLRRKAEAYQKVK